MHSAYILYQQRTYTRSISVSPACRVAGSSVVDSSASDASSAATESGAPLAAVVLGARGVPDTVAGAAAAPAPPAPPAVALGAADAIVGPERVLTKLLPP